MMRNWFTNAVFNTEPGRSITVRFTDNREMNFTTNILNLLKSDPSVEWIADSETGELIYWKE